MRADERCGSRRSVRFGELLDHRTRRSSSKYDAIERPTSDAVVTAQMSHSLR